MKTAYPPIDYMYGKHKPRVSVVIGGGFKVEILTTWVDLPGTTTLTQCPHAHRTERGAERCMLAWNEYAHDERRRIVREGNGGY